MSVPPAAAPLSTFRMPSHRMWHGAATVKTFSADRSQICPVPFARVTPLKPTIGPSNVRFPRIWSDARSGPPWWLKMPNPPNLERPFAFSGNSISRSRTSSTAFLASAV